MNTPNESKPFNPQAHPERRGTRRWGILGLGNIARKFTLDLKAQGLMIHAVASRDENKAKAFAHEFGIHRAYGSYEALLADAEVDAVYIALPNSLHAVYTLAAARAGKAVLCEKPFVADGVEAKHLLREIEKCGVLFMEGFMYRCHPQYALIRELLARQEIGAIRLIEARFSYNMGHGIGNIRSDRTLLGGSLLDVGCYGVSFARWALGEEPSRCKALAHIGPTGVDTWFAGALAFPGGALASVQCGSQVYQPSWAALYGEKGRIEIPEPWKPMPTGAQVRLVRGSGASETVETLIAGDGLPLFAREALAVEAAMALGQREVSAMTWSDTIGQAHAMGALRAEVA